MTNQWTRRIESLPPEVKWSSHCRPPGISALAELERRRGVRFPDDFREFYEGYDGGSFQRRSDILHLESVEAIADLGEDEMFVEHVPRMLPFGDDGGGRLYYFDPDNLIGRGPFAVFLVSMGVLEIPESIFCGRTVADVADAIISGADMDDMPKVHELWAESEPALTAVRERAAGRLTRAQLARFFNT